MKLEIGQRVKVNTGKEIITGTVIHIANTFCTVKQLGENRYHQVVDEMIVEVEGA